MNRQPLNVELLTLDDGTQKIAWDVKQLQSLLGISDLLHQEELSSAASTGVNSSGIPTIETVIAILDELGLKDLYEVRYRKQYATIIPKTDSKRPKVAMYVVQQQSELALSIHEKIWNGNQVKIHGRSKDDNHSWHESRRNLYVLPEEKRNFIDRLIELVDLEGSQQSRASDFEDNLYSKESSFSFEMPDLKTSYTPLLNDMIEENICYELSSDQRFPSTSRIFLSDYSHLKSCLSDIKDNVEVFLRSNGEKPESLFKEFKSVFEKLSEAFEEE
ncbi:hypothetical protein [Pseudanabaena sp. UWO310]|uniref:hypothetical protein n=1 Tax=Pseudanabaena sp. UWO310 TaxID=2480795 RepID=UPI00167FE615